MSAAPGMGEGLWFALYRDMLGGKPLAPSCAETPAEPLAHTTDQNLPGLIIAYPALCLNLIPLISERSLLINIRV